MTDIQVVAAAPGTFVRVYNEGRLPTDHLVIAWAVDTGGTGELRATPVCVGIHVKPPYALILGDGEKFEAHDGKHYASGALWHSAHAAERTESRP